MITKKVALRTFFSVLIGVLMGCSLMAGTATPEKKEDRKITHLSKSEEYEMLQLFGKVYELTKQEYVEEVGEKELLESAMDGMLTGLDPHSEFLTADEFKEMDEFATGEFGGIGASVTKGKMGIMVIAPMDDTPAFKAGIQPGDYITHIDGEQISELSLSEAVKRLKGKPGTKVKLTIFREGQREPLQLTLKRAVIKVESVKTSVKRDGKIGYIRMSAFDSNTFSLLEKGLKRLKKDGKDLKGYVLDLRNNSGGLLPQAISVTDAFITSGEIVSTRPRKKEESKSFFAEQGSQAVKGDLIEGAPLVVLINQGSASASEIVAGALQDHKRAIVVGTKSYGKGSVQSLIQVTDTMAVRLTTSRYYLPSGRSIQAEGVMPDVEVKVAKIEEDKTDTDDLFSEATQANALDAKKKKTEDTKKIEENASDYQLERAMDLVQGLSVLEKK